MKALRRSAPDRWLDYGNLASWATGHVGGERMVAAYYYTGVPSPNDDTERHALSDLLDELDRRPGFFVKRFNRRATARACPHCHEVIAYTEEKMVDTSIVADMVLLATRDAYDVAVVFSGDLDIAPAITAVHALGKQAWVATFGDDNLSRTLSRSAWGLINLLEYLPAFSYSDLGAAAPRHTPLEPDQVDNEMHRELRRAQAHFEAGGGFVGAHYFIHRWKGHHIPEAPEARRQSVQRLMDDNRVETYEVDGKTAMRVVPQEGVEEDDDVEVPGRDEDETVQMRIPESLRTTIRRRSRQDD